jgi:hypothetical protein
MQTFLAYPEYIGSMMVLDKHRLGNQVYREGKTLATGGWPNHPASKMWRGHENSLCDYLLAGVYAMSIRGWHKPEVVERWRTYFMELRETFPDTGPPFWVGDPAFHAAHRSNLLRKNPDWYAQFGWTEPDDLEYVWPVLEVM